MVGSDSHLLRMEFQTQIQLARSAHQKCIGKNTAAAHAASDRAIARWSLYAHLRDCPLTGSSEQLLQELRRLQAAGLPAPIAHVNRQQNYEQARVTLLHHLANRLELERSYE